MHVVLECPAYSDLRALHGPLFAALPLDPALAMRLLFCPSHFRPLARFLRACHARRAEFVAGRLSPLPPQLDLPLDLDLFAAVALPGVWARLLACLVLVGWFVLCLFLAPVLVRALWLSLRSVG